MSEEQLSEEHRKSNRELLLAVGLFVLVLLWVAAARTALRRTRTKDQAGATDSS